MTPLPADEAQADPVARKHRRGLIWSIAITLTVFGGIFATIIYSDAEPPDLADLAFTPVEVADEENLYLRLAALGKGLAATPLIKDDEVDESAPPTPPKPSLFGSPTAEPIYLKQRLLEGEGWSPERLAKYGPELETVATAALALRALSKAQGATPRAISEPFPTTDVRYFCEQLRLAAWARYHAGRPDEAVELALTGMRFGRLIRDARGPLLDYLVGLGILSNSRQQLHALAARPDMPAPLLRRLLDAALEPDPLPDAYEHTLRNEFRINRAFIEGHDATQAIYVYGSYPLTYPIARTRVLFPLIYKPRLTVALHAESVREELKSARETALHSPAALAASASHRSSGGCAHCEALNSPASLFRPVNAHGRAVLRMFSPTLNHIRQTRLNVHTRQSLLQAYLALRLHHLETGALPATLDDLVPALLPAVPRDFADGKPIRYSREARALWSVGADPAKPLLVTSADQAINPREIFHRLDFANPEPATAAEPAK
jgi:hypothetical protein